MTGIGGQTLKNTAIIIYPNQSFFLLNVENAAELEVLLKNPSKCDYRLEVRQPSSHSSLLLKRQNIEDSNVASLIHYLSNDFDLLISGIYQVYFLLQYFVNRYMPQWGHH